MSNQFEGRTLAQIRPITGWSRRIIVLRTSGLTPAGLLKIKEDLELQMVFADPNHLSPNRRVTRGVQMESFDHRQDRRGVCLGSNSGKEAGTTVFCQPLVNLGVVRILIRQEARTQFALK